MRQSSASVSQRRGQKPARGLIAPRGPAVLAVLLALTLAAMWYWWPRSERSLPSPAPYSD
jgi:hypothetical protein